MSNTNDNTDPVEAYSIEQIENLLSDLIEFLKDENYTEHGVTRFYVIEKKPYTTRDPSNQYNIYSVALQSDLRDILRRNIIQKTLEAILRRLQDETAEIPDFFELKLNDSGIIQVQPQRISTFESVLTSIKDRAVETLISPSILKRLSGHAIEIKGDAGQEIITFTRDKKSRLIKREDGFLASFFENEFRAVQGDILVISPTIDGIYLKTGESELALVLSRKNFEMLFNVREYYEHYSRKLLEKLRDSGLIEIAEDILAEAIKKRSVSKNLTLLLKNGAFPFITSGGDDEININTDDAKEYFNHLKEYINTILPNSETLEFEFEIINGDNGDVISFRFPSWNSVKQFVNICKRDYLEDPVDHKIYYAPRKRVV